MIHRASLAGRGRETLGVATLNVGGGNNDPEVSSPEAFDKTRETVAREVSSGRADVVLLQEVGVNNRNTKGRDNNQEILEEVFLQELPPDWDSADFQRIEMGDSQSLYLASKDGQAHSMLLSKTAHQQGIVAYDAVIDADEHYTLAFGPSDSEGTYGNSVLLGPGYELQELDKRVLGDDPDHVEDRTAIGVRFRTPGGEQLWAVSAHLTNGPEQDRGDSRNPQYLALDAFAEELGSDVLVGGDFNSRAGGEYGAGSRHPSAEELGWVDVDPGRDDIDRLYTMGDVKAVFVEELPGVEEVHGFKRWDVSVDSNP